MNSNQKNIARKVYECSLCTDLQGPPVFLEGNPNAKIWIIGLNPKLEDNVRVRESLDFKDYLKNQREYFYHENEVHYYFRDFRHVLGENWLKLFQEKVSHTDLVKCHSKGFDDNVKNAINDCGKYLKRQIELFKPEIILCNGSNVCDWFKRIYNIPNERMQTKAIVNENDHIFTAVFSGFIGRIDNYAKYRLGKELSELTKILSV
jgi:uracil-DNA glycosylase